MSEMNVQCYDRVYTGHGIKEGIVKSLRAKKTKTKKEEELKLNIKIKTSWNCKLKDSFPY